MSGGWDVQASRPGSCFPLGTATCALFAWECVTQSLAVGLQAHLPAAVSGCRFLKFLITVKQVL